MDASHDRPLPAQPWQGDPPIFVIAEPPPKERIWLHVFLFLATVVSTSWVGGFHYAFFTLGFNLTLPVTIDYLSPWFYIHGLWFSGTVLGILGCHEMGHYYACRYYRVNASPPYFLPAPLPLTGTLGAFIRIRERIPNKVALFDIGLSGPITGFVVAVPALFIGLALSRVETVPEAFDGMELGEPLLFRAAAWLVWGSLPDSQSINMHPMAFAAWFGLLATALNLFPMGQLDGGHVTYAVLGRRSTLVTFGMIAVALGLTVFSTSWIAWTVLMVLMLVLVGPVHPPTLDDSVPLDRVRLGFALFGLVMLIVCFTPAPIEPFVTGGG